MKPVEMSYDELVVKAKQAEGEEKFPEATSAYLKAIKLQPANLLPYSRLMILYRKQKMYKEELKVIEDGIRNIQATYDNKKSKIKSNATILKLSNALMKSTGLVDKKGQLLYEPEPVTTWKKRREIVINRLKKMR